jgi:hypothetical protein
MALVLADRVQETTNTVGTGTLTLAGAVSGFQAFTAIGNANTTYYTIVSGTLWETGVGTYTLVGTTLSRDTVFSSSAAGAKIAVTAGASVFCSYPASQSVYEDATGAISGFPIIPATGTGTVPPLDFIAGTNLVTPLAGAMEYDGNNFYVTSDTSQGRNVVQAVQQFYISAAAGAISGATQNYFGATSAASLAASSTYDIECFCYFLKTTSGTMQWLPTFSSAVTAGHSFLEYTPVTGFNTTVITGAMVVAEATQRTSTVLTHVATAALTTAVYHIAKLRIRVVTNAACNFRLNGTISAGSITPQIGSFYTVRKVVTNAGNFVA